MRTLSVSSSNHQSVHNPKQPTRQPPRVQISTPLNHSVPLLQRKSGCACGGRCPRCQDDLTSQTKLKISRPNDRYEQEADHVANQVMGMPTPQSQSQMTISGQPVDTLQTQPLADHITPLVQRQANLEEEEELQAKTKAGSNSPISAPAQTPVDALRSGGMPLPSSERAFFEPRFGTSFEQVRIHTHSRANSACQSIQARAFTAGNHIAFAPGEYQPGSNTSRQLLAHELTHTLQQTGSRPFLANTVSPMLSTHGQTMIQRDLAIEPPNPTADGRALTPAEVADAIAFNQRVLNNIDNSADIIELIRDVIGVSPTPAIVDDDFVQGVVNWQASYNLTQDGKLGPRTARPLFREIGAEGEGQGRVRRGPRYNPAGPINVARGGVRQATFNMFAEFESDPANKILPSCCEVRQDIQWDAAFVASSVAVPGGLSVPHNGFPAAHPADTWIEDRNEGNTLRYGHRARFDRGDGNQYLDNTGRQNQAFGHIFRGRDNPSGLAADRGSWRFRLRVIDVCNGDRLLATSRVLRLNWL